MRGRSLNTKIVTLLIAALGACQVVTLVAVLVATHRSVRADLERELQTADTAFAQLFEQRYLQQLESVDVLAADFGFKRAAASGDAPTIASALGNHAARAEAALAVLVDPAGAVIAASGADPALFDSPGWQGLVQNAREHDIDARTLAVGGRAYQLVAVPVKAPQRIAWLVMGFHVDDALARRFRDLTGREISFVSGGEVPAVVGSTLPPAARGDLPATLVTAPVDGTRALYLDGDDWLTRVRPLDARDGAVIAVLQESLSRALAPYHELSLRLALLFVVALGAASAAGIAVTRGITRPLRSLMNAAARIGEGHYGTPIAVEADDEVGRLAATLDSMQSEIGERENRIIHQAHHDELTGLPNRRLAVERLHGAIARAAGRPFTVAQIDLARFKHINDTFGHHVGDVVLEETARRLVGALRPGDTVARLGGDDFFVILEDCVLEAGLAVIESLRTILGQAVSLDGMQVSPDFRIGIATCPEHGDDPAALMRRAEIALYDAKDSHRRTVVYASGRDDDHLRQLAIVSDLPGALERGEVSLHYQPKISFVDGRAHHAEALVRWTHPEFGFMPPDEFIQVLEESGNIGLLTEWVITTAIAQIRAWADDGLDIGVGINLSAMDLLDLELPERLVAHVEAAGLRRRQLILEITESAVMRDPQTAVDVLGRLREAGFRLA
ncbi:MAG: diguanylate cyclase, partial [Planctomycetes bacterium]|nr:diguanylate cyclase [Planctomycetota bacterium]